MQKCSSCEADLPENSRFCGKCGSVQDSISTEDGTLAAILPPSSNDPAQGSAPAWSPNVQAPTTLPPPPVDEDERRRSVTPLSPLFGAALAEDALLGSVQASTPGAPVVQGTPQIGNVPSVAGSPTPYTNVPASQPPMQGAGNVPASQPMQGAGNVPVSHPTPISQPVQGTGNVPVSHPTPISQPVQGTGNVPVSHPTPISQPVQGTQPTHQPPERPKAPEHHPPHKPHRHHSHPLQHEPHRVVKTKVIGASSFKTIIIVVTAVVVVAAGGIGAAAHFLSHPQPLIRVSSNYTAGNTSAGANGTVLHISGQQFSSNSAITFLLDGHVAPGNPGTQSDSNGNFSADITITNAWSVGTHTLTAIDASNASPKNSVSVMIVQQGEANTPGPDGAPPDDASFKVIAQIQRQAIAGNPYSTQETEFVTGHPDPMGGTVCQPEDNGQPIVTTGVTSNTPIPFRNTYTFSCAGSYKGGKLTLTETLRSEVRVYSLPDGTTTTCTLNSPQPVTDEQVSGSYTGNNTFSGTITYPAIPDSDYSCNGDGSYTFYNFHTYEQFNWTGQVTDLHS